jgi:hypothetical protein
MQQCTTVACKEFENIRLGRLWAQRKAQDEVVARRPPMGQTEEWMPLKLGVKLDLVSEWCQNGHKAVKKACGNKGVQ